MNGIMGMIGTISFIGLFFLAIINQIIFIRFFNKLKRDYPSFLDSKINKYSYFDSRSQFAMKVFFGKYQEVNDIKLKNFLCKQRLIMIITFVLMVIFFISFGMLIFIHH